MNELCNVCFFGWPKRASLQQVLRTLGRTPFVAAADNAAVDLVRQLDDPALAWTRLWHCGDCKLPPDPPPVQPPPVEPPWDVLMDDPKKCLCERCRLRLQRLHLFLALPLLLLQAAVTWSESKRKEKTTVPRIVVAVGEKAKVRIAALDSTMFKHRQPLTHPGVLNHDQSDVKITLLLKEWVSWSAETSKVLCGDEKDKRKKPPSHISLFCQLRKRQLIRFVEELTVESASEKVSSVQETRAHVAAVNKMAATLEKWCADLDAFIIARTGEPGEQDMMCTDVF